DDVRGIALGEEDREIEARGPAAEDVDAQGALLTPGAYRGRLARSRRSLTVSLRARAELRSDRDSPSARVGNRGARVRPATQQRVERDEEESVGRAGDVERV